VLAKACGADDFPTLLRMVSEARQGIATAWAETFGEALEEPA
jgi:hypothetical protein